MRKKEICIHIHFICRILKPLDIEEHGLMMGKKIKIGPNSQEISSDIVPISSANHKAKVSE